MIPLRGTEALDRFPTSTLFICLVLFLLHLMSCFMPESRASLLLQIAALPQTLDWRYLTAGIFYPHWFSLLVSILYLWVFLPRVINRRGLGLTLFLSFGSLALSLRSFAWIHPLNSVKILAPEALVGCVLGLFMRKDIWGTVTTLIVGMGWLRVYEVPSYVLLFFWFFYLLLSNLFLDSPFSEAPMLYWIPFSSFLMGFVFETLLSSLGELRKKMHNKDS